MSEPSAEFDKLVHAAQASEARRALGSAAALRLVGTLVFLTMAVILGYGLHRRDWSVYVPNLAAYLVVAALAFSLRRSSVAAALGAVVAMVDVGVVYLLQQQAMPLSPFPAGVAGFSLGLFALLVSLSGLTLNLLVLAAVALAGSIGQALLMHQAGISTATIVVGMAVLPMVAAVSYGGTRRLRHLAFDLSRAELQRQTETQRFAQLAASSAEIEKLLEVSRAQNERLTALQRDKDSLIQLVVHDLRSPLTAMVGNLAYAESRLTGTAGADVRELLEDALASGRRLDTLISEMLELSRLEEGRLTLTPTQIAPAELLGRVSRQSTVLARERSIVLEVDVRTETALRVDVRLMTRVLENLVSNAIRYAPVGQPVRLCAQTVGGEDVLSVHNNGPAIEPAARLTLFEKYRQGSDSTQRNTGWGLGLYFCSVAVQSHGGRIAIEDVPGWTTSFVVRLPAAGAPAAG